MKIPESNVLLCLGPIWPSELDYPKGGSNLVYLDWDTNIKAPVSSLKYWNDIPLKQFPETFHVDTTDTFLNYLINYYDFNPFSNDFISIVADSADVDKIIQDNCAGRNGEHITLSEIRILYYDY